MTESEESDSLPRRHTFLQEESRMLSALYKASEVGNHWRLKALCGSEFDRAAYGDIWFAPDATDESYVASELCFQCPVRQDCLLWACLSKQKHGIWGGLPASVRVYKGSHKDKPKPHDYERLRDLPNPYTTENDKSRFRTDRLAPWSGDDDDE